MVKKAIALAGAGVLLLSAALPVLGNYGCYGPHCGGGHKDGGDLSINNFASVFNDVYTKAVSGDADLGGKHVWGGSIRTGAATAGTSLLNEVNTSLIGCDCIDGDINIHNGAFLMNHVRTKAYSGDGDLGGWCVGGGSITTGAAGASSVVQNLINMSVVGY